MRSKKEMVVFVSIVLGISTVIAWYLSFFIAKGWHLSALESRLLWFGLWLWFPFFIGMEVVKRNGRLKWGHWVGVIGLGVYSIAVAVFSWGYAGLILGLPSAWVVGGCLGITGILAVLAFFIHRSGSRVITLDLSQNPGFKHLSSPLKLVHLTDIHLTHHTSLRWVKKLVEQVNALKPDFILFTGDLLDAKPESIPHLIECLKGLKAKHGKFAVSGNHDFMTGIHVFHDTCHHLGFKVLDQAGIYQQGITFVGVSDEMSGIPVEGEAVFRALIGQVPVPKPGPVVLLKHRPTGFRAAAASGVHLQLSGHSHKGQLPPFGTLVRLRYRQYAYGLHKYKQAWIYTSRGTGVWGPPMRLFRRSEIVVLTV